jgi:hypothetical protein
MTFETVRKFYPVSFCAKKSRTNVAIHVSAQLALKLHFLLSH